VANKDFVVKNSLIVGDTATINGVQIDPSGATSGQVLKFDGSKFAPASDITVDEPSSYSTTIGNGSSSSYTLTHNLNTRDVVVSVQDSASPYDVISVRSEATTANTVTLDFSSVVSSSSRDVLIISAGDLDYYTSTIGDGSNSSIVLNHNLGSRDIAVAVRNASSPYEFIDVATFATSPNKVTLDFSSAPSADTLVASVYLPLEGYSYSEIIGDGSTSVFTLTHDLNTRNVNVVIRETQSPYQIIKTYWEATTADTVSVAFETAPSTGSIEVTVFNGLGGKLLAPSLNDLSVSVPASSSSDGQKGDFAYDVNYIYICTATNTWKRSALTTW
jgi:sulfur transfer complex TusBCD TusB component (DsrH family)